MSPSRHLRVAIAATALALGVPAGALAATSTVTAPADGTPFVYDDAGHPGVIPSVDGTASGATQVDLHCASRKAGTWSFSSTLSGGSAVDASGGTFHAANVTLPAQQQNCLLLALPTGQPVPADPSGYGGPRLRLLATLLQGAAMRDTKGGANQGKPYDFFAYVNGTGADMAWSSAASGGVESSYLLAPSPEEAGQVFSTSDAIPLIDPSTGPGATATSTGLTVDATNAYLGKSWEDVATGSVQGVFSSLTPFPTVVAAPSLGDDGALVMDEHDVIVKCTGADPNYFSPAGFTCPPLHDAGVALDLQTSTTPKGTVITRRWRFTSTDGQVHALRLVLRNSASLTTPVRTWQFPGETGYAPHAGGNTLTPAGSAPWTVRFHSDGVADGDVSKGVGAITSSLAPVAVRFSLPRSYDATYVIAVPATGSVELRNVLMGEATQAALEQDIAAAEGVPAAAPAVDPPPTQPTSPPAADPGAARAPAPSGPPARPALPAAASVIGLPPAKACVSRRRLTLHLHPPAGLKVSGLTVKVAKRTTRPKLHGSAPVVLTGLPKGRYTVTVTVAFADGRRLKLSRTYLTCGAKRRH